MEIQIISDTDGAPELLARISADGATNAAIEAAQAQLDAFAASDWWWRSVAPVAARLGFGLTFGESGNRSKG